MQTFLLVWNPKRWPWEQLTQEKAQLEAGERLVRDWSCGTTQKIGIGDRVFIIRVGLEPKGIVASGTVVAERHEKQDWDESSNRKIWYVTIALDTIRDPDTDRILPRTLLDTAPFQPMHWNSQMSGIQIPESIADALAAAWHTAKNSAAS